MQSTRLCSDSYNSKMQGTWTTATNVTPHPSDLDRNLTTAASVSKNTSFGRKRILLPKYVVPVDIVLSDHCRTERACFLADILCSARIFSALWGKEILFREQELVNSCK